jgi:uncharacterized protein YjbI with pentapeptide repeats
MCQYSNTSVIKFSWLEPICNNMNIKVITTTVLLTFFGFTAQTFAFNEKDLELLKATNACPRCDLSGADLSQANLSGVNLRDANLRAANLSQANLTNADFTGANLETAVLTSANLTGASFTGASLKSATLENADLSFTGFISANLQGANINGAKLQYTNFRGANFRLTTMPTGVVTSDKPYWWSLQRETEKECDKFKTAQVPGSTCYGE